jgi:hypothetical protein
MPNIAILSNSKLSTTGCRHYLTQPDSCWLSPGPLGGNLNPCGGLPGGGQMKSTFWAVVSTWWCSTYVETVASVPTSLASGTRHLCRCTTDKQGCQILLSATYQNWGKCT